jgi:hypothetical protein
MSLEQALQENTLAIQENTLAIQALAKALNEQQPPVAVSLAAQPGSVSVSEKLAKVETLIQDKPVKAKAKAPVAETEGLTLAAVSTVTKEKAKLGPDVVKKVKALLAKYETDSATNMNPEHYEEYMAELSKLSVKKEVSATAEEDLG